MPQVNQGIHSVLSFPCIYSLFGKLIGGDKWRKVFLCEYVKPDSGDRILDIGCGPGDILPFLPDVEYIGFDASQEYISAAQARASKAKKHFTISPTFICQQVAVSGLDQKSCFDIALAVGILHHLDDIEALKLFELAKVALKPGGRLITFDGVYVPNQSPIARWIISKDRGQNVRTEPEYVALAQQIFPDLTVHIRYDLLNIPYTHIILECRK